MPHGKKYDAHERECIAKAFAIATCNKIKGKDQPQDDFHQNMFDELKQMEPKPTPEGKYSNRTPKQVYDFWRDKIQPDINRFIFSLRRAHATNTTGNLGDDEYEAIAVALHLNESNGMALYNKRDFDRNKWMNFKAYQAVQHLEKFRWDFDGQDRRASTDSSYHSDDSSDDHGNNFDSSTDDGGGKPSALEREESASASTGVTRKRRAGADLSSKANAGSVQKQTKTTKKFRHVRQEDKRSRRGGGGRDKARKQEEKEKREKKRQDERNKLLKSSEDLLAEEKRHNDIKERALELDALKTSLAISRDQGDNKKAAYYSKEIERLALEIVGGRSKSGAASSKPCNEINVDGESSDGSEAAFDSDNEFSNDERKSSAQSVESTGASDSTESNEMEMRNCDTDEDKYNNGRCIAPYSKERLQI